MQKPLQAKLQEESLKVLHKVVLEKHNRWEELYNWHRWVRQLLLDLLVLDVELEHLQACHHQEFVHPCLVQECRVHQVLEDLLQE